MRLGFIVQDCLYRGQEAISSHAEALAALAEKVEELTLERDGLLETVSGLQAEKEAAEARASEFQGLNQDLMSDLSAAQEQASQVRM